MTEIITISNFHLYHGAAEMFSIIIAFAIFIVASNTCKMSKNDFFMFLGLGYFFVGLLDLIHTFSFSEFSIFPNASLNMVAQFYVAARAFELVVVLLSTIILYKKIKNPNFYLIASVFVVIFTFLVFAIIGTNIFSAFSIEGMGHTEARKIAGYLVSLGFLISALIIYKARGFMDKHLFLYIELSLILKVIHEISFTLFVVNTDLFYVGGQRR